MDALVLFRDQVTRADDLMRQVFANVNAEQAVWRLEGSTANAIVSTFLHVYGGEDRLVHRQLQNKPPIFETGIWHARLGIDPAEPWTPPAHPDLDACRAYAAEVRAATRQYLEGLEPGTLEQEIDTPRGRQPVINRLNVFLLSHKLTHLGEIAALLGCQGVKGFPV